MDQAQIELFIDLMVGWENVGESAGEPVERPNSPALRAFVVARIGNLTPPSGWALMRKSESSDDRMAFAAFLREAADAISPRI